MFLFNIFLPLFFHKRTMFQIQLEIPTDSSQRSWVPPVTELEVRLALVPERLRTRTVAFARNSSFLRKKREDLKRQNNVQLVRTQRVAGKRRHDQKCECGGKTFGRILPSIVTFATKKKTQKNEAIQPRRNV